MTDDRGADAGVEEPVSRRSLGTMEQRRTPAGGVTRRAALGGGAAAVAFLGAGLRGAAPAQDSAPRIDFRPLARARSGGPNPAISPDYRYSVLIPWGDPLTPGGPAFHHPPTAADRARQVGAGHDGMTFFSLDGSRRGLLAVNFEFVRNAHLLGKPMPESLDDVRAAQHAIGAGVVEIEETGFGRWRTVASGLARRVHVNTPVAFAGPAAGLLAAPDSAPPAGTLNNCADGRTPWRTWLTCEENFHFYFGAGGDWTPNARQTRYGLKGGASVYGWERFDRRFDLADPAFPDEENRFGWVVEIDPFDPGAAPVKRTALGRFRHEGAAVVVGRGNRVVVYMGDDERFEHIYKFVSADDYEAMLARGENPLDRGTLYAARFYGGGVGEWRPLTPDIPAIRDAGLTTQAEVLAFARLAADAVWATPMDRPEWATVGPEGDVYMALTNNRARTAPDAANPVAPNPDGHILRWRDTFEHTGDVFVWEIFRIAADTHGGEESFSSPDGLWADPDGRLFIQTDGDQQEAMNNQMLVADAATGALRRLFSGVPGAEITGIATTPDRRTMFVNVQHPGNGDPALTNFPVENAAPDGATVPRDATVAITRKDGGVVGS